MLSQIHAGLHHVDDIVAELFALLDDVEVGRSEVVGIFMIIDIVDVLVAETLAQVVDVVLNLERFVYVHLLAVVLEGVVHLRQGLVGELEHFLHILAQFGREALVAFATMGDGACQVVAAVADAFYLTDFAQHVADFHLRVVTEMGVAHMVEVFGNLDFHAVADNLVFLDALHEFGGLFGVLLMKQVLHHAEHALYALAEAGDFLLCLKHAQLGRFHDASLNEAQAEVLLIAVFLGGENEAYEAFELWYETDEQGRVGHVESCVESRQHDGEDGGALCHTDGGVGGVVAHNGTNHVHERIEQAHDPCDADDVEKEVGEGSTARLRVSSQCGEIGCGRRTDVLTHDEGYTQIDGQDACGAEQDGDGHDGCRALHEAGDDRTDEEEEDDGPATIGVEGTEEVDGVGVVLKVEVGARCAQQDKGEEEKSDAEEEVANVAESLGIDEDDAHEESREHGHGEVHVVAQGHDPRRERRTDVSTHDDGDGLCQREKSGIDEGHSHHRGGRGGLHGAGDKRTCEHTRQAVCCHGSEDVSEL